MVHQPFFNSGAGEVSLLLVGGLIAFMFAYIPRKFREARVRDDAQLVILTRLQTAVIPAERMGLVQRVEQLERNMDVTTSELERHIAMSQTQKAELEASVRELRERLERALTGPRLR